MSFLTYKFKEEMLDGTLDHSGNVYGAQLCTSGSLEGATNPTSADIVGPATGTTIDPTITSPTALMGVFNGLDVTFVGINGGGAAGAFVMISIYVKSGTNALRTMAQIDITEVTQTGGNIAVQWDNSSDLNEQGLGGIFAV